jgi:hypothetical protein
MNQNLHAPAKYPPFENREGWGSLTRVGQPARGPLDAFWSFIGHPVPYETFCLEVIDIGSGQVSEYPIRKSVQYGSATIVDWVQ